MMIIIVKHRRVVSEHNNCCQVAAPKNMKTREWLEVEVDSSAGEGDTCTNVYSPHNTMNMEKTITVIPQQNVLFDLNRSQHYFNIKQ